MKGSLFKVRSLILAAGLAVILPAIVSAQELLTIDLTVVDQITITATDAASGATISGGDLTGIYFENIFGAGGTGLTDTLVSGDLTNFLNPADGSPELFRGGGGSDPGLNVWSWSSDEHGRLSGRYSSFYWFGYLGYQ